MSDQEDDNFVIDIDDEEEGVFIFNNFILGRT